MHFELQQPKEWWSHIPFSPITTTCLCVCLLFFVFFGHIFTSTKGIAMIFCVILKPKYY